MLDLQARLQTDESLGNNAYEDASWLLESAFIS